MEVKEQIIKPITMVREEFVDNIANLINASTLPFFVIEDILKNFLKEVHIASQHQMEVDKQRYEQEIQKIQLQLIKDVNLEGDNHGTE